MDETQSPSRRRRRIPKTNNIPSSAQSEAQPAQQPSLQPSQQQPRNRGRNNGPARSGRGCELRSTTPETTARSEISASTPHDRMKQVQVSEIKFAGVFTNSPAASALPIPSFCVKPTTPQSPTRGGNDSPDSLDSQDDSEDGTQSSSDADTHESQPSPASPMTTTPAHMKVDIFDDKQESPLDRIFRADREEKQRASGQENSVSPRQKTSDPLSFTPTQLGREARVRNAFSRTSPGPSANSRISPTELNGGTPGWAIGPAFSTPYNQRISNARRTSAAAAAATPPQSALSAAPDFTDRSEALKRYLFGSRKHLPPTVDSPQPQKTMHTTTKSFYESIYARVQNPRSPDLDLMEDNLRRILNLNPPLDSTKMHEQPPIYS